MEQPVRILQPGEKLGSYTITRQIGKGGMGVVYEAARIKDGKVFAIKALTIADKKRNFEYTRRFLREARLAAAISHPNVVKVVGFIQQNRDYYIIMEYFSQGTVKDRLNRDGRLPQSEVARIGIAVARALEEAAKVRIVHRDIKPDNIMLAADGTPRLADLGLATLMHDVELDGVDEPVEGASDMLQKIYSANDAPAYSLTLSRMAMGTPAYMAPEQAIDSRTVDTRADIYSLGATLFHLLNGEPPFSGKNIRELLSKQLHAPVPDLRTLVPGVSPGLAAVIEKCMGKLPEERYQNAGELAAALEALQLVPPVSSAAAGAKHSFRDTGSIRARAVEFITLPPPPPPAAAAQENLWQRLDRIFSRDNLIFILELLIAAIIMGFAYYLSQQI